MSKAKNKAEKNEEQEVNPAMNQPDLQGEDHAANQDSNEDSFEAKLKEQEDKYLRLYAEFENFRKRSSREKVEYFSTASSEIIIALLPVLDDFDRAIKNNETVTDVSVVKEGFQLIYTKLNQILESKGLKAIDAMNQPFDYDMHEAIANVPVEDPALKGKVIDQVEKGYSLNDKVIRFPKVAVGL
jgi:molecular chaperone GrpE